MAQLAIKGHPTRGKEVIQLLEMFGGKSNGNIKGYNDDLYYYIAKDGLIYGSGIEYEELACNYSLFTLEEFLEKLPYKVDDLVVNHKYGKGLIIRMLWIDNEIVYEIEFEDYMAYCKANELCKYDAFKGLLLQELTERPFGVQPLVLVSRNVNDRVDLTLPSTSIKDKGIEYIEQLAESFYKWVEQNIEI